MSVFIYYGVCRGMPSNQAPELFDYKAMPTIESDIFSFGHLLWELMGHRLRLLKTDYYDLEDNYKVREMEVFLRVPLGEEISYKRAPPSTFNRHHPGYLARVFVCYGK
jgi:hypothetical protein